MSSGTFTVAVLPGDGIGIDVTLEAVKVLRAVERSFVLKLTTHECGAVCYQRTGCDLPPDTLAACRSADAVLLGAMGHPDIRKPDGTELTPQVTLRVLLDLYAGLRPCKLYPGARSPLANVKPGDIDLVIVREQTEGLFASQQGGIVLGDQLATDTLVMTRRGVSRICEFGFRQRRAAGGLMLTRRARSPAWTRPTFSRARLFPQSVRRSGRHLSPNQGNARLYRRSGPVFGAAAPAPGCSRYRKHVRRHPFRPGWPVLHRRHGHGRSPRPTSATNTPSFNPLMAPPPTLPARASPTRSRPSCPPPCSSTGSAGRHQNPALTLAAERLDKAVSWRAGRR